MLGFTLHALIFLHTSMFFFSCATSLMPFSTCLAWSSWEQSFLLLSRIFLAKWSLGLAPGNVDTEIHYTVFSNMSMNKLLVTLTHLLQQQLQWQVKLRPAAAGSAGRSQCCTTLLLCPLVWEASLGLGSHAHPEPTEQTHVNGKGFVWLANFIFYFMNLL